MSKTYIFSTDACTDFFAIRNPGTSESRFYLFESLHGNCPDKPHQATDDQLMRLCTSANENEFFQTFSDHPDEMAFSDAGTKTVVDYSEAQRLADEYVGPGKTLRIFHADFSGNKKGNLWSVCFKSSLAHAGIMDDCLGTGGISFAGFADKIFKGVERFAGIQMILRGDPLDLVSQISAQLHSDDPVNISPYSCDDPEKLANALLSPFAQRLGNATPLQLYLEGEERFGDQIRYKLKSDPKSLTTLAASLSGRQRYGALAVAVAETFTRMALNAAQNADKGFDPDHDSDQVDVTLRTGDVLSLMSLSYLTTDPALKKLCACSRGVAFTRASFAFKDGRIFKEAGRDYKTCAVAFRKRSAGLKRF